MTQNQGTNAPVTISKQRTWAILLSLMFSITMPCMAAVGRSTLLPSAMADLNSMQYFALVAAIGALAMSITLPIAGKLGDLYGRRRIMVISQLGFIVSMCLIVFGNSLVTLAGGIFLAGIFYGFLSPSVRALVGEVCPEDIRPTFLGLSSSIEYLGMLVGPIIAGYFCDIGYWKGLYAICIPVMVLVSIALNLSLPKNIDRVNKNARIDIKGIIALIMALGGLLTVLNTTGTLIVKGSATYWGVIAVTILGALLLIIVERNNDFAILPVQLMTNGSFVRVLIVVFALMFPYITTVYYAVYIQNVLGYSATMSGTLLIPNAVVNIFIGTVIGWLLSKTGKYKLVLIGGALINLIYCVMFIMLTPGTSLVTFEIATILFGIGYGGALTIGVSLAQDTISRENWGVASGLIVLVDPLSYAIAASVSGPLMNLAWNKAGSVIPETLKAALSSENAAALLNQSTLKSAETLSAIRGTLGSDLQPAFDSTVEALRGVLMSGIRNVGYMCLVFVVIGIVMACTLKEKKQERTA